MTEVTDTHRRAGLRGREAVARRRINSGVRAGRVLGIVWGLASIVPLALREPRSLAVSIAFVAGILLATERMRRAVALLRAYCSPYRVSWQLPQGC